MSGDDAAPGLPVLLALDARMEREGRACAITAGATGAIHATLRGADGAPYDLALVTAPTVTLHVRKHPGEPLAAGLNGFDLALTPTAPSEGRVRGVLARAATAALPPGRYRYEVVARGTVGGVADARLAFGGLGTLVVRPSTATRA